MTINDKLICIKNFKSVHDKFIEGDAYKVVNIYDFFYLIGDQNVNMLFDQNNINKYFITEEEFKKRKQEYRKTKLNKILKSNE